MIERDLKNQIMEKEDELKVSEDEKGAVEKEIDKKEKELKLTKL